MSRRIRCGLKCDFLTEYKLDNVGFFAYSREDGTRSFNFRYQIPSFIKKIRLNKIRKTQEKVVSINIDKYIGNTYNVVCDGYDEEMGRYYGRAYFSCPDVDYLIFFDGKDIKSGEFVDLKITGFYDNYFIGEML